MAIKCCNCSRGDNSREFRKCLKECQVKDCKIDRIGFKNNHNSFFLKLMQWTCTDNCKYQCMWFTVDYFMSEKFDIPQFFGKWPFIRFLGMQEPASVIFSLMNLIANVKGLVNFRKEVRPDSPCYWLYQSLSWVCIHAWMWSAIFHARDTPLTEFMDYSGAFSIVLMTCYCMTLRLLRGAPRWLLIVLTVFFTAFFLNHIIYLYQDVFDYDYNMQVNVFIGSLYCMCWFIWALYHRRKYYYTWKIALFVILCMVFMLLEVIDRPPFFYVFDSHALWHLFTSVLPILFFSFCIDDCRQLRKDEMNLEHNHKNRVTKLA